MPRVLVTDAEQRSALAVTRSLSRAGWEVHVGSSVAKPLAGASRAARMVHRLPDLRKDPQGFLSALDRIVEEFQIDVLLPLTDVSATLAVSMAGRHPGLTLPLPPPDVWSEASDKRRLMEIGAEVGVPVPRQFVIEDLERQAPECVKWAERTGFPVVLKPHRSAVHKDDGVMGFGVKLASDEPDLLRELKAYAPEAYPILVQERIIGPGLGAFFLCNDGEIVATFAHRRLREKPPTGGVSVLRESVPMREDLRRHSAALLGHFRWSGVAMVEFKEDTATGTAYLMEINGRFWGSLQLAIDAGVDFPVLLLDEFVEGDGAREPSQPAAYRHGVRSRWFWGDVDHLLWFVKAPRGYRRDEPALPSRMGALLRFLVPWRPGQSFEVLRVTDIRPFFRESGQWVRSLLLRK